MKVGSKVVCVSVLTDWAKPVTGELPWVGRQLTVRDVVINPDNGNLCLRFEEIVCKQSNANFGEAAFNAKYFREIDAMPDLSDYTIETLLTEIEEPVKELA